MNLNSYGGQEGDKDTKMANYANNKIDQNLKKILKQSLKLKSHDTKTWLRKKVSMTNLNTNNLTDEDSPERGNSTLRKEISKQYLMSD